MNSEQALIRNMRTCRPDVKGEANRGNLRGESTDAGHRGGPLRSSVEVSVMEMESRRWLVQLGSLCQPAMGGAE